MVEFIDITAEKDGTPLNRANMMAVQGFEAQTTVFNDDGSITQTNALGQIKNTVFNDNQIVETFVGEKTIVKTTTFNADGSILEAISG